MLPTLFNIGSFTVTSFGFFTLVGLIAALYVIWRLSIFHEMDKEKIIDLFFLVSFTALLGSRVSYIIFNLNLFPNTQSYFQFIHFPGFYFWGGFLSALVLLIFLFRKNKESFWQLADIVAVGLFASLTLSSIGCLLGSCQYGYALNWPISVYQSGLIDKRFPIQLINTILYLLAFTYLYRRSFRFHFTGMIASLGLIILSIINFSTSFFRADLAREWWIFNSYQLISLLIGLFGVYGYYKQGKRSLFKDMVLLKSTFRKKLFARHL